MDHPTHRRTPLRTEVLWFLGVAVYWTFLIVGGFWFFLSRLMDL